MWHLRMAPKSFSSFVGGGSLVFCKLLWFRSPGIGGYAGLLVCLFVCYLFELVEVLAAMMWTCYTHPSIHSQRTATTLRTSSPTLLE